MKYSIQEVAKVINAEAILVSHATIKWLLTDSRSLFFPEESLFFALKTSRNDGHRYIADMYKRGLRHFVVSDPSIQASDYPEADLLYVKDTLNALQQLGASCRNAVNCPILAITGSNGKTIVKEWLWQLMRKDVLIERSPRSYNSRIGVPLSLWQLNEQTQLGVFEAGISEPDEMHVLQTLIRPTIGILTNIGAAHQENFRSLEQKAAEKVCLFQSCEHIVYCLDQPLSRKALEAVYPAGSLVAWSRKDTSASLFIEQEEIQGFKTGIRYTWEGRTHTLVLPFSDEASVENALHCLTLLLLRGVPVSTIAERMAQLEPVAMRLEVKEGKRGCVIINDSYNADVNALELALDFQARRAAGGQLKRTLILSDILQSGQEPSVLYQTVANLLRRKQVDNLIAIGHDLSAHARLFDLPAHFFLKTESLLQSGLLDEMRNTSILIKGSRSFGFEVISERLSLKVHETVLEVNLDALVHNLNYFRSYLKPTTQVIAMVKAGGYGNGSLEVARTLQTHACDAVAVAVADEGVELRHGGITMPILVMNPEFGSFSTIVEHKLEPEIYSFKLLEAFIREAEKEGVSHYPIHIKLDTGMHRLGFEEKDLPALIERLKGQESLRIRSVFSHLAGSDDPVFDDYTNRQLDWFERMSSTLMDAFDHHILRHILNSAGIERFPRHQYDMVRLGIGLYGISVKQTNPLKHVSTLKTTILQIRTLDAGQSVGYSRKCILDRPSRIATLPIGYADGLDRHLGNGRGEVVINGQRAPIIGNVCMDACMIDVTDIQAEEGDQAIIFGETLPVGEVAANLETISYEVLTSVSNRVKRVYFQE